MYIKIDTDTATVIVNSFALDYVIYNEKYTVIRVNRDQERTCGKLVGINTMESLQLLNK